MSEIFARITPDTASQVDSNFKRSLDALERGECGEDEFLRQALILRASSPNWAWSMLALIDQRYRRGALAEPVFRSIKSQISRLAVEDRDYGTTVELHPAPTTAADASQELDFVTAGHQSAMRVHAVDRIELDRSLPTVFSVPSPVKQAPQAAEVGRVLRDRYELQGLLGRGGMGTVFKALDRNRRDLAVGSRHVAVKVLHESIGRRPEILADLRREFYCAQALSHPNIVKVHELHQEDDAAFFTMELIEGELLSGVLRRIHPRPLARQEAWAIIRAIGAGLAHAHSRNVVHGDLKPQNIMLTERGEIRILDFGASSTSSRQWSTSDALQRGHFLAVTPAYTCCELLDGQQTDPRDDLYALACLSYELLAGDHPFQGRCSTEARDLEMQARRPRGLTHRQWRSLRLGLSWYREDRPSSVRAWLEDLGLERMVERLPAPHDLDAMQAHDWTLGVARRAAVVAAVIVGAGLWVAFGRTSFDVNHAAKQQLTPSPAPVAATSLQPTTASQLTVSDARVFTQPPAEDVLHPLPDSNPISVPAQPELLPKSVKPLAMTVALRPIGPPKISLSADTYRVPAGERFAEIDVDRSGDIAGSGSFVWWTEPASAKAGNDFVYQGRTTQRFSSGRHVAKIFVRLIANPTRTHLETFYVAIADPSREFSLGHVARAAVLIPPGS
jgi:serine/threonine protein kinase